MALFWNISQALSGLRKYQLSEQIVQDHARNILDEHRKTVANIYTKQAPQYYKGTEVMSPTECQKLQQKARAITPEEIDSWKEAA